MYLRNVLINNCINYEIKKTIVFEKCIDIRKQKYFKCINK